jgi:hypothetical protein
VKDDSSDHITPAFPVVWCPCLRIWTLLSVIRGLVIAALPWMLDLWSSRWTGYVGTRSSVEYSVLLSCHLCCSSSVTFRTILLNVRRSLCVNVDFRPLYLFADVVLLWFVNANITLETVALDAPNNVAGCVRDSHKRTYLFQNRTSLQFSEPFTCILTQHTETSTTECKQKEKEHSVLPTEFLSV